MAAPFNLPWGSSVYAKIVATNAYGNSLSSDFGNGAIILTNPDAPTTLQNNLSISRATQIGITWVEGAKNGGTPVIDYTITYD